MRTGENIFKRRDGRWEARYHKGRDSNGKLIYGFCYGKSYSEAKARVEEAKQQTSFFIGTSTELPRKPFHYYCEEWLKANQLRVRDSTHAKYHSALKKHLKANPAPDKKSNQMAWVQHMNMLKAQAEEVILTELINS